MRRELMIRLIRSFLAGTIEKDIDRIPYEIRPKGMDSVRCCIYKDRAIIKYRLMALLGASYEAETDESKTLKEYLNDALARRSARTNPLPHAAQGVPDAPTASISLRTTAADVLRVPAITTVLWVRFAWKISTRSLTRRSASVAASA